MKGRNEIYIKVATALLNAGYEKKRCNGSHFIFSNGQKTISLNKDLNRMVARRILKECNLQEV